MCRLLAIHSVTPIDMTSHLQAFAGVCERSRFFQGHGWGVAYWSEAGWVVRKDARPIWEAEELFSTVPVTSRLIVHARYTEQENSIALSNNHPFESNGWVFAFNGHVAGMRLKVSGATGAHKIFHLLQEQLVRCSPEEAMRHVVGLAETKAKGIEAMNMVLANETGMWAGNFFYQDPDYLAMHYAQSEGLKIICSQPYAGYTFEKLDSGRVVMV